MWTFKRKKPKQSHKTAEDEYVWVHGYFITYKDINIEIGKIYVPEDIVSVNTVFFIPGYRKWSCLMKTMHEVDDFLNDCAKVYEAELMCIKKEADDNMFSDFIMAHKAKPLRKIRTKEIFKEAKKYYSMIETLDEFKKARKLGSYYKFCYMKYSKCAMDLGYSEEFARLTFRVGKEQMNKLISMTKEGMPKNEIIMLLTGNAIPKVNITEEAKDNNYETDEKPDMINHPPHYTNRMHECIEEMRCVFGIDAVIAFCKCNAWKYRYRANSKGKREEDMAKSDWYINKAMELEEEIMGRFM